MGDYDYCKKHDTSFLMPDLLQCPWCAVEKLIERLGYSGNPDDWDTADCLKSLLHNHMEEIKCQNTTEE
jgi:hypothetical protein